MSQAQSDPSGKMWEKYETLNSSLKQSIDKLALNTSSDTGLSQEFLDQVKTEPEAVELCEKAMESLAGEYINHLTEFKESLDPINTLAHLDQAEMIWREQTCIITHFDAGKEEALFLLRMREHALNILENKLEQSAERCQFRASDENITLCLALMVTIDYVLGELGVPLGDSRRQRLRRHAKEFN